MKERIEAAIRTVILGCVAATAGVVAFGFVVIAVFFGVQARYDTTTAAGALAALFGLVALIALITLAVLSWRAKKAKRAREAAEASATPSWLSDPSNLLIALQIARTVGFKRLIPIALLGAAGAAAAGLFSDRSPAERRRAESLRREKRAA